MSEFALVDRPFREWAEEHSLPIFTNDRDWEIRATEISLSSQAKWSVWLVPDNEAGTCRICYSGKNPSRQYEHVVLTDGLRVGLQQVLAALLNNKLNKAIENHPK